MEISPSIKELGKRLGKKFTHEATIKSMEEVNRTYSRE